MENASERDTAADPQAAVGELLPELSGAEKAGGASAAGRVQTAYVEGVSTRKVDNLLQALGLTGIDKSKVSRICKELDAVWRPSANGLWRREIPDGLRLHQRRRIWSQPHHALTPSMFWVIIWELQHSRGNVV